MEKHEKHDSFRWVMVPSEYFSYFPMKTYVVGTHKKHLSKALLMSTTTYVFLWRYKKDSNSFVAKSVELWNMKKKKKKSGAVKYEIK